MVRSDQDQTGATSESLTGLTSRDSQGNTLASNELDVVLARDRCLSCERIRCTGLVSVRKCPASLVKLVHRCHGAEVVNTLLGKDEAASIRYLIGTAGDRSARASSSS